MRNNKITTMAIVLAVSLAFAAGCQKEELQPKVPQGAINAQFSVAPDKQVYFSQGNLQYRATTNTWRFAEKQYDRYLTLNEKKAADYDGWIDLFAWGTSGYDHGAVCYQPWSKSWNWCNYYAYGDSLCNLNDKTGQADWGSNAISNGGDRENYGWRTLTKDEWDYVINQRITPSGIRYAKVNVWGVPGLMLLPDDWNSSIYKLDNPNTWTGDNEIVGNAWTDILEPAGVVFLPEAGTMFEDEPFAVFGTYWSSSIDDGDYPYMGAYVLEFWSGGGFYLEPVFRSSGNSVRLVYPVERLFIV